MRRKKPYEKGADLPYCAFIIWCEKGENLGRWFCFPLMEETIREKAEILPEQSFWIGEWSLPFELDEHISIEEANQLYDCIVRREIV